MTTSCAAILGVDEGTEAVIAEPCDGGFEIRTSAGTKCIPRITLSDPPAVADAGNSASGDSAPGDSAAPDH